MIVQIIYWSHSIALYCPELQKQKSAQLQAASFVRRLIKCDGHVCLLSMMKPLNVKIAWVQFSWLDNWCVVIM